MPEKVVMMEEFRIDALYVRQSIDKKESISIESQLDFCKYETRGEAYEEYVDRGFSGKNTNRPAFEQMMKAVEGGKIKRVIVYKLDRISRSILDFANMMETFQKYNVEFVSSTEKFDTSTPIGRAMLNICIVFAQLERETIQKRVSDAYYSRSQKGFYMGGRVPYGFKLEKTIIEGIHTSHFVPDDFKALQVKKMFQWYTEADTSLGEIQRRLCAESTDGLVKNWCTARISEILRNPIYVKADMDIYNFFKLQGAILVNPPSEYIGMNGAFLYKGRNTDGTKKKQYDLVGREVVLAPHAGIIDSATWLRCRLKLINNRQAARTNKAKRTWLAGKMKCKKCGYAYVTTKNINGMRYFQCSGARYAIKCAGIGKTIYADQMEEYIYSEMQAMLAKLEYLSPEKSSQDNSVVVPYQIEIADKDKEIELLLDKLAFANPTLVDYINKRIKKLDEDKKALSEKILQISSSNPEKNIEKITSYIDKWDGISIDDKQKIVDILIKVIYIGEEAIEIEWNI